MANSWEEVQENPSTAPGGPSHDAQGWGWAARWGPHMMLRSLCLAGADFWGQKKEVFHGGDVVFCPLGTL